MCEHGQTEAIMLTIPARLSHSGQAYEKLVGVDRCIAPLVRALNDNGVATVASCCGHKRMPGNISLADGRELLIAPDYDTARDWHRQLGNGVTIHGELMESCQVDVPQDDD